MSLIIPKILKFLFLPLSLCKSLKTRHFRIPESIYYFIHPSTESIDQFQFQFLHLTISETLDEKRQLDQLCLMPVNFEVPSLSCLVFFSFFHSLFNLADFLLGLLRVYPVMLPKKDEKIIFGTPGKDEKTGK